MQLLKGYGTNKANVVACEDFAAFIIEHMNDKGNPIYEVGGKEPIPMKKWLSYV